jgi:hypothetical protein
LASQIFGRATLRINQTHPAMQIFEVKTKGDSPR